MQSAALSAPKSAPKRSTPLQIRNLLFDLDGTLTDSRPGILACVEFAMKELTQPIEEDLSFCLGPPLHQSFARLLKTDDPERVAHAVALYRKRFVDVGMFENSVYHGIPEMLATLQSSGHRLFVATSKVEKYAVQILTHFRLDHFFDRIYGSEMDGRLANKGELIRHLLAKEDLVPAKSWMVGDREHDIHGAKQNGLTSLGVLWGYGSATEFEAAGADHFLATPKCITHLACR